MLTYPLKDSGTRPATLDEAMIRYSQSQATGGCNTSTFNIRLIAGTGEKAEIRELQTMPNGNFLLVGNITSLSGQSEGLVCVLNNGGAILATKRITLNGTSTILLNGRTKADGSIYLCGAFNDASGKVFVTKMNLSLLPLWTTVFETGSQPPAMFIDFTFDNRVTAVAQLSTTIFAVTLDNTGTVLWRSESPVAGMDLLAGIGHNFTNDMYVVVNCTRAGKKVADIIAYNGAFGTVSTSHTLGNGVEEFVVGRVSTFNNRFYISGFLKDGSGQFKPFRKAMFNSASAELKNEYNIPLTASFNCAAAHDNSGDAMAFSYPNSGKLVYVKQFPEYMTTLEATKSYDIPIGARAAATTRSLEDGGYLFGINNSGKDTIILIKTDSSGILSGCGLSSLNNNDVETLNIQNTLSGVLNSFNSTTLSTGTMLTTSSSLNVQTLCNQIYCPPSPPDDTCLATYVKIFRSNSYSDAFYDYGLMRNNTHLFQTYRRDRVMDNVMQVTYGLKLFSERGDFIKGVNIFTDGESNPVVGRKMDDQHMMLMHYTSTNTASAYTFTLVNDSLNIVWSKSYQLFPGYNYNAGVIFGTITKDNEGNFYYVHNSAGYFQNVGILVHKMGPDGNVAWTKVYSLPANAFLNSSVTVAGNDLVIVSEGGIQGSISMRINKNTGQFLNAWLFNNFNSGSVYDRYLKYDNGRIFYAGTDASSNSVLGIFDESGMPVKLRHFNVPSRTSAHAVKFGKFFFDLSYYTGTNFKEGLARVDTSLNIDYINEFDPVKGAVPFRMYVSDNGSIYHAGNFTYGGLYNGYYYDPYLKKTDTAGITGTCPYQPSPLILTDLPLNIAPISATTTDVSFIPSTIPVVLVPDIAGHNVAEMLCSSTINCTDITLSGPSAICQLNQPFSYMAQGNAGCSLLPSWAFDPAYTALQSTNAGTAIFKFLQPGTTKIYSRINSGCTVFTDSIEIQIQNSPFALTLGRDTVLCPADSLLLHAGPGFSTYLWQDGSTDSLFTAHTPGTYHVEITNACGDRLRDTIIINGVNIPLLNLGADQSLCRPDTLHLNAQPGFTAYQWYPASVISSGAQAYIIPLTDIQVHVKAATPEGCIAKDTINIQSIFAPTVFLGNDTSFCNKDTLQLTAGSGYVSYLWSTGAISASVPITQPGIYWVKAIAINGCYAHDTLRVLQLYNLPQPLLGNDFNLCSGDNRQLDPGNFNTYLWQDGSTSRTFPVSIPGIYHVTVTDINHCKAADTIMMLQILPIPGSFLKPVDSVCQYSSVKILPTQTFSTYSWNNGSNQNSISVSTPGTYILTVKDNAGCTGKDTIRVVEKYCTTGVFIPTAFTPNNDGLNDFFNPVILGPLLHYKINIYNRNGELVFTSSNPSQKWNGYFKGAPQPVGVFVWSCRYQLAGGLPAMEKGIVTLIR